MFGLLLYNLWVGVEALKDSSIAEMDHVPYHVTQNVHSAQAAKVDSGDIGNIVQSLEASFQHSSGSSTLVNATRSQKGNHKEYVQLFWFSNNSLMWCG